MIRHELITPAPHDVLVAEVLWDLTAGVRYEMSAAGMVLREGPAPVVTGNGVKGLGHAQFEVIGRETPRVAGRRRTGQRAKARPGFLPAFWKGAEGAEWVAAQRLFWRCVTPETPIRWRVTSEGAVRELVCQLNPEEMQYDRDPSISSPVEPIDLLADDPFWQGPAQVAVLAVEDSSLLFFGDDGAPDFYIGPSSVSGEHRFMVDGDLEAWPVLEAVGPMPAWSVTSLRDGSTVEGFELDDGDRVIIDFDPTVQAAILMSGGVDSNATAQLAQAGFFRLIADADGGMDVEAFVAGTGHLELTYRPRYWRAF